MVNNEYINFLEGKRKTHIHSGFDVNVLPDWLFEFQKFVVKRALKAGKYAIFSGTGTGKMRMELSWSNEVNKHTNKPVLILAPLGVTGQIIKEGEKVGVEVKRISSNENELTGIYITNYEQLNSIDEYIYLFSGVCLDESSIIKSEEGATTNRVIELFAATPYKLCGTATPSPNDPMELGNHAEFLGVMSYNVMLAMYFVHDAGETQKWRIKKHAKKLFWQWVSSWSIMFQHPRDIGFEQDGYDLPPLNLIERQIKTTKRDNGKLFNDSAVSATNFNKELRLTKVERLDEVADIVNNSSERFVVWIKHNDEEIYLKKLIPDAVIVTGSDEQEYKEDAIEWFTENKCICKHLKKKGNQKENGMPRTESDAPCNRSKEMHSGEHQTRNGTKTKKHTTGNTISRINTEQKSIEKKPLDIETNLGDSNTTPIQSIEKRLENNQEIPQETTRKQNLETGLNSMGLPLSNMMNCSLNKTENAPFAEKNQPLLQFNNGCMLTIATQQEKSGGYLAETAITQSENSPITQNYLTEPQCTCGASCNKKILISKTSILGKGLNFQICHNTIYASPDFSWEQVFQSLRRFLRYGQSNTVNAWLITTDTMLNVMETFKRKQKQFEDMQAEMTAATNEGLCVNANGELRKFEQYKTDKFMYQLGDCVQLIKGIPDESIGMSIWSPPFPTLYVYSNEIEDMGNSKDFNEFFTGFNFLIPELNRVMILGRDVVVHCMDVPIQKGKEGYIGLRDFSGMIIDSFCGKSKQFQQELKYLYEIENLMIEDFNQAKCGHDDGIEFVRPEWLQNKIYSIENKIADAGDFIYHSRVTLWKNPVTEMQRTKALGLLHKQVKKDASMCRVGIPDYLLVFRKPGENPMPIIHQDKDPAQPNYLPVDLWQKYASPVWMDIDFGDTLNSKEAKDQDDERHIAPLSLEVIRRSLHLWSNEGDTILTTYGGIGSEGHEAIKLRRKAILFELKKSYYDEGVKNLKVVEASLNQPNLFSV